jgi:formylglycine-generating enzyme required for sulfatase activity
VATVSNEAGFFSSPGLVRAVAAGSATITATCQGKDGNATITVTPRVSSGLGVSFGEEEFALIPAGTFQMGDMMGTGFPQLGELPVHTVNITEAFYMQKTEVTQWQWKAVMGTNPSAHELCGDDCPVGLVSWNDIQEFLTALNAMDPGRNYRLPTEAEWEYAARAGTTGDFGGTGILDDMGWYEDNADNTPHPVALKQPNAWGLYDMHGNQWEFVQDWFSATYYQVSPTDDPTGPLVGSERVIRSGTWATDARNCRSAMRSGQNPTWGNITNVGFRLARTQ